MMGGELFGEGPSGDYRWVAPGETITIGKYTITAGLFYYGTSMCYMDGRVEASLVNPKLAFPNKFKNNPLGAKVPDDLNYAALSPLQRREYLAWLAGGRTAAEGDLWKALIFLQGLEYRFFCEADSCGERAKEQMIIREEAGRLASLYGINEDAASEKLSAFFTAIELKTGGRKLYSLPIPYFKDSAALPLYLELMLSEAASDKIPLSAELAYVWFFCDDFGTKRPPVKICKEEFKTLFYHHFNDEYTGKLFLELGTKRISTTIISYSGSIAGNQEFYAKTNGAFALGDNTAIKKSISDIMGICALEMKNYMLYLDGEGEPESAEVKKRIIYKKPVFFWDDEKKTVIEKIRNEMDEDDYVYAQVGWLVEELDNRPYRSELLFMDIVRAFEDAGLAIEPDVLTNPIEIFGSTYIIIHKLVDAVPKERWNTSYQLALDSAQLAAVAVETCFPERDSVFFPGALTTGELDDYFYDRVYFAFLLMCHGEKSLSDAVKRFKKDSVANKKEIIRYIKRAIEVYGDKFDKNPATDYRCVQFLEKLYKALNIKPDDPGWDLSDALHEIMQGKKQKPQSGKKGAQRGGAEKITKIVLDQKKIHKLREDTEHVSKMLSNIFTGNDVEDAQRIENSSGAGIEKEEDASKSLLGLDASLDALLQLIITKENWEREELEDAAKEFGLMFDGAIETINEKTFELFDEALIEVDEEIRVNSDIIKEIKEIKKIRDEKV
jgi:hypothetical protein